MYINIRWFGTATSSTNKTDCHDITEILSKIEFNIPNSVSGRKTDDYQQ
jgi:hypothetical protein